MSEVVVISPEKLKEMVREAVESGVFDAISAMQTKNPKEMNNKEAAEYLGIAPMTLRIWRTQKKGPKYHKNGKAVRYARSDLDAYLKRSEVHTIDSLETGHETFGL